MGHFSSRFIELSPPEDGELGTNIWLVVSSALPTRIGVSIVSEHHFGDKSSVIMMKPADMVASNMMMDQG